MICCVNVRRKKDENWNISLKSSFSSDHPTTHFHVTSKNVNKRIKILYFLLDFSSLIFKGRMYLVTKARFYEPTFFSLTKTLTSDV